MDVISGTGQSFDGIVQALSAINVSAANLLGVNNQNTPSQLDWSFQLIVPLNQVKSTTASLLTLQNSIPQNNSGLTLSFYLNGANVSQQAQQTCDFNGMMSSARAEAQSIASAAGFTAGSVVGITGSVNQSAPVCSFTLTFGLPLARSAPNAIAVAASRTANPPPDQVQIAITVTSMTSLGLDQVSAALAAAGITGTTFIGIGSGVNQIFDPAISQTVQPTFQWSFALTTPLTGLPQALAHIGTAQQNISKQNPGLTLSFSIQAVQASSQSQPPCNQAGLVADARLGAQTLAALAGVSVGPILNLSDQAAPSATSVFISGDFAISAVGSLGLSGFGSVPSPTCSVSVQFQLL